MASTILRSVPKAPRPFVSLFRSTASRPLNRTINGPSRTRQLSTDIRSVNSKGAMQPVGPYSQAIQTPHAIYCSGQLPADAQGNLVEGSTAEKTKACLEALKAILTEAGSGLDRIVKVQIFLTDMADFVEMNREYQKFITHKPARSCVAVKQLPKDVSIEIECIALPGMGTDKP